MKPWLLRALAAGFALVCGAANALITQVSTPALMSQGPYSVENFEDSVLVPGLSTDGVFPFSAVTASSGVTTSGANGVLSQTFPDTLMFSFATPASSVGMFFGNDDICCAQSVTAILDIFGTTGLLGSISVLANMNDFVDQFIGFISDEQVTSVGLRYLDNISQQPAGLFIFADDVQFNAVVEPASLGLLALGLGLIWLRLRRPNEEVGFPPLQAS